MCFFGCNLTRCVEMTTAVGVTKGMAEDPVGPMSRVRFPLKETTLIRLRVLYLLNFFLHEQRQWINIIRFLAQSYNCLADHNTEVAAATLQLERRQKMSSR